MSFLRQQFASVLTVFFVSLMASGLSYASLESEQQRLAELQEALSQAKQAASTYDADLAGLQAKYDEEQVAVKAAEEARDATQATFDEVKAQYDASPNPDLERKLKDAEYQSMLSARKLGSAKRSSDRAERKLNDMKGKKQELVAKANQAAEQVKEQEALIEQMQTQQEQEASNAAAEAKAKAEAEARKAAEAEAARQAKEAEAAELEKQFKIDPNCLALPNQPTNPTNGLTALDAQVQSFAKGELRRVNRLIGEAPANDAAPFAQAPVLEGNKLKPCDPAQKQMLTFSYLGNGQYRLETRVLAGEQEFWVKDIVAPIRRIVQPEDDGEMYTFFLDVKYPGRYKLVGYKKSLFDNE